MSEMKMIMKILAYAGALHWHIPLVLFILNFNSIKVMLHSRLIWLRFPKDCHMDTGHKESVHKRLKRF